MNLHTLFRRAFSDIRQHLTIYCLTTIVVTLTILICIFFSLIYFNLHSFVSRFGSELGIVVYLEKDIKEGRIPEIYRELLSIKGVEEVVYISSEEAFKRLESYLGDESQVLEGVEANFLPPSFEVKVKKAISRPGTLSAISNRIKQIPEVSKVQYGKEWVQRLETFTNVARNVVIGTGLLLLSSAAFVVSVTIKLNVYSRHEEIEIMRLVGATNGFIEAPFLIEAMLQGLLGSSIAIGVLYLTTKNLGARLVDSPLLNSIELVFLPKEMMVAVIGLSILLCCLGTHFSMRKVLKT